MSALLPERAWRVASLGRAFVETYELADRLAKLEEQLAVKASTP
jgi:hypothetical protein